MRAASLCTALLLLLLHKLILSTDSFTIASCDIFIHRKRVVPLVAYSSLLCCLLRLLNFSQRHTEMHLSLESQPDTSASG